LILKYGSISVSSTIKQKTTTPKGVFVFMETVESLFSNGIHENKKTMSSMVVVFYLQDWNKGINDPPNGGELLPAAPPSPSISASWRRRRAFHFY